jgi:hypothetical protein
MVIGVLLMRITIVMINSHLRGIVGMADLLNIAEATLMTEGLVMEGWKVDDERQMLEIFVTRMIADHRIDILTIGRSETKDTLTTEDIQTTAAYPEIMIVVDQEIILMNEQDVIQMIEICLE